MRDFRLSLNGVRCFAETGFVRIAPLTLLVGENSTGKSSFLAFLRTAWELAQGKTVPNFNRDPFFLGAFDQIAHHRGGKAGRKKHFSIVLQKEVRLRSNDAKSDVIPVEFSFEFGEQASQPFLQRYTVSSGDEGLSLDLTARETPRLTLKTAGETFSADGTHPAWGDSLAGRLDLPLREVVRRAMWIIEEKLDPGMPLARPKRSRDKVPVDGRLKVLEFMEQLFRVSSFEFDGDVFASAPVRTKPARTYDPVDDTPTSEGGHVPMALLKIFLNDKPQWERLKETLEKFGKASGLFEELSIKSLGRHASGADPFQIMVKVSGPKSNLIDVGYGVSQVLPILFDLMGGKRRRIYLLQQPEVHLHPRAQAELGSFLGSFVKARGGWVVAETHSDYIIDRLRMDIRDKKGIGPDDVSILYFERTNLDVKIHSLSFDKHGNLHGAPESYRSFFLREEERMLGIVEE
jgi:hypothetical protein